MFSRLLTKIGSVYTFMFMCVMNLIVMHYYLLHTCKLDADLDAAFYVDNLIGICFDILFVFFITYWVSLRKTKWALVICFIITGLWSFSSVMYSRFFFHYLSLSAINQGGALGDDLIIQCIKSKLHLIDLYYPVVALLFTLFIIHSQKSHLKLSIKKVIIGLIALILIDLSLHVSFCMNNPQLRYASYMTHRIYSNHFVKHLYYSNPKLAHFLRGEIRSLCAEMLNTIEGNIELTDQQLADIKSRSLESEKTLTDSVKVSSTNVIFILVESYMSFTSDLTIKGKEITPFLNSLKRDSSVYYNGKMRENVTLGGSSDGQFIYMTGLLPLRSIITLTKARHVTLPGLPKYLRRESRMIIPTVTSIWEQDEMCRQYGFDHLYARNDFVPKVEENLTDEQVFQLAIQKDKESTQPFFSIVLTMSMHQPYESQIDSTFQIKDPSITDELANYLNVCHYTDRQIEMYFKYLVESGLYDHSLIIIAADHPVDNTDFGGVCNDIPLYIVNASGLPKNMWQGECNQVDVYTTLLDLLGCGNGWYGLGHSLVSPTYENPVSSKTWDISEWIIMGDYFSKK